MGYSDIGVMGSEIQTPYLDRLARKGVLMTHLYTTARCCPSRASLMTGHYSHTVGMGHMDITRSAFDSYGPFHKKCTIHVPAFGTSALHRVSVAIGCSLKLESGTRPGSLGVAD